MQNHDHAKQKKGVFPLRFELRTSGVTVSVYPLQTHALPAALRKGVIVQAALLWVLDLLLVLRAKGYSSTLRSWDIRVMSPTL